MILEQIRQLPRRLGGTTGLLIYLTAVLALGVLLPWYLSFTFLDSGILLAYACLSLLLVPPVVAESFAGDREWRDTSAGSVVRRSVFYSKIAAGILYGWISTVLIIGLGLMTVSASIGRAILPPTIFSLDLGLFSLAISIFTASAAAAVSVAAPSARHAKRILRQAFLLLLVILMYYSRFMSGSLRQRLAIPAEMSGFTKFVVVTSVILLALSGGLLKLARRGAEDTEIRLNI